MSETVENILQTYLRMPADFWVKILIAAVVLLVLLVALKKIAQVGQWIFVAAIIVITGIIVCKWVRFRGEPEFMTPIVDFLASFFGK